MTFIPSIRINMIMSTPRQALYSGAQHSMWVPTDTLSSKNISTIITKQGGCALQRIHGLDTENTLQGAGSGDV